MNLKKLIKNNLLVMITLISGGLIIGKPNYLMSLITLLICVILSFILHYFSHLNIPIYDSITRLHISYHHDNHKKHMLTDLLIEFLIDFFIYGGVFVYIIIYLIFPKQEIFIGRVAIMYALFYTSIHLINYTLIKNKIHIDHHLEHDEPEKRICNLGPDFMDHLFETSCKNMYENNNLYVINLIIIIVILKYLCK